MRLCTAHMEKSLKVRHANSTLFVTAHDLCNSMSGCPAEIGLGQMFSANLNRLLSRRSEGQAFRAYRSDRWTAATRTGLNLAQLAVAKLYQPLLCTGDNCPAKAKALKALWS